MVGGHSEAAARRAGSYGDEFYPHWSTRGPNKEELARLWPIELERFRDQVIAKFSL